jgi:hypothetical protein
MEPRILRCQWWLQMLIHSLLQTVGMLVEPPNLWSITAQRPELIDFAQATNEVHGVGAA